MPIPEDWNIHLEWAPPNGWLKVEDPRGMCPYCRKPSTFAVETFVAVPHYRKLNISKFWLHFIVRCNSISCAMTSYVKMSFGAELILDREEDDFFVDPSRTIAPLHPAVPAPISQDWVEAQKAMEAGAPKAAAVMC